MMDHMYVSSNKYLHLYGALFVFSVLNTCGNISEYPGILSLAEPRGSAHMASFSSSESVIVGKTLPAEVAVPQASMMKGDYCYDQD
jgi:hypothetical protein